MFQSSNQFQTQIFLNAFFIQFNKKFTHMYKEVLKFLIIILTLQLINAQCNEDEYEFENPLVPGECFYSTDNPFLTLCPEQNIPIQVPNICGILPNDILRNFTTPCEAYFEGAQGYFYGPCTCNIIQCPDGQMCQDGNCVESITCDMVTCGQGFECFEGQCEEIPPECVLDDDCIADEKCKQGKCEPITCDDITCPEFQTCEYLVCFRKYDYFCSKVQPQIQRYYCPIERPTEDTCPTKYFAIPPEQTICGIAQNGDKIDFIEGCQACKRYNIQFYYNQPCSTIPDDCDYSEICENGQCIPIDYCKDVICEEGKTCASGVCIKGLGYCENDVQCPYGYFCNLYEKKCQKEKYP